MARVTFFVALLVLTTLASAAAQPSRGLLDAEGRMVSLIDQDRREWQGRLMKISADAVEIDGESGPRLFKLDQLHRIDADGDGIGDGFVKGALLGVVIGVLSMQGGGKPGPMILGGAVIYGGLGTLMDAMNDCRHTVYRAPSKQVAWTVRW
jgi:hypothetical protein